MYIKPPVKFQGHPKNVSFFFLKILMVSDKTNYKAFRIHKTHWTKPIREIFNFHYLANLYIGFKAFPNFLFG